MSDIPRIDLLPDGSVKGDLDEINKYRESCYCDATYSFGHALLAQQDRIDKLEARLAELEQKIYMHFRPFNDRKEAMNADRAKCVGYLGDEVCPLRDQCLRHMVQIAGANQVWMFPPKDMENCEYFIEWDNDGRS